MNEVSSKHPKEDDVRGNFSSNFIKFIQIGRFCFIRFGRVWNTTYVRFADNKLAAVTRTLVIAQKT